MLYERIVNMHENYLEWGIKPIRQKFESLKWFTKQAIGNYRMPPEIN
jgi:hypothetical protein